MVRPALGIAVEEGTVRAAAVRRGGVVWLAAASWTTPQDLESAIAALAAERPRGFHRVNASAGGRALHFKIVAGLPSLAPTELRCHISLAASKYFFDANRGLVTDAASLDGSAGEAVLTAWRSELALAVWRGCRAAGLELGHIVPRPLAAAQIILGRVSRPEAPWVAAVGAAVTTRATLSLVPDEVRSEQRSAAGRRARRVVTFIAATLVLGFALHVAYLWHVTHASQRAVVALAERVQRAAAIRRDVDAAHDALRALERASGSRARLLPLLGELARLLPDSSFLTAMNVAESGGVLLTGYAKDGMAILAAVERATGVSGVAFEGGLSREGVGGSVWDRFGVTFRHIGWSAAR